MGLLKGGILFVDKPEGWSSFDVVKKIRNTIRNQLGVKKIKVGHAGTLDPMATGLLILAFGQKTSDLSLYQNMSKSYHGCLKLGGVTPTYDKESEISEIYEYGHISAEMINRTSNSFLGTIMQTPPVFSAIKKEGVPLYKYARKGIEVDIPPREVVIESFDIKNIDLPMVEFNVVCSKGTYIRSLVNDFGKALSSGAFLWSLRRTAIGPYSVSKAWDLSELLVHIKSWDS